MTVFTSPYEEYVKIMLPGQIHYVDIDDDDGSLILHYFDGRVLIIATDDDGHLMVGEKIPHEC